MIESIRTLVKITVTVGILFSAFAGLDANMAAATEKPSAVSAGKTQSGKTSENEQPSGSLSPIFHPAIPAPVSGGIGPGHHHMDYLARACKAKVTVFMRLL